jgi:hypothetical protein
MRVKLIAVLVAGLFAEGSALAADDFQWTGAITLGGQGVSTDGGTRNGAAGTSGTTVREFRGPADEAKATEYQDLTSGVLGVIDLRGGNSRYYLKGYLEELGRDDQYINILGGGYGSFKGQFYQDKIPHNLSWNALTPLSNPGSNLQTGTGAYPPYQNPATWNYFDYGLQRDTIGGNAEVSLNSPFFARFDYNEVKTSGTRPGSGQLGTGSGNGLIEFGVPTDYKTKNTTAELGYAGKSWNVKLGFLDSKFTSNAGTMQWTNFYMLNGLDTTLQPPDSDLQKWSLNASFRDLPFDSTLMARATYSSLTNSVGVASGSLKPTGNQAPPIGVGNLVTTPSSSNFDGEHTTTSLAFALTSALAKGLESRLYYNYYDKANESTQVSYNWGGLGSAASTCPQPIPPSTTNSYSNSATRFCIAPFEAPEPYAYTKNEAGIDLTYRLGPRSKLLGGFNYLQVDRDLEIAEQTRDSKVWLEYRNSMLMSNLGGRLKYQFVQRRSDYDHRFTASGATNTLPTSVTYYYSEYDFANYDQNQIKANLDWTPLPMLTTSIGATWRWTDYKNLEFYGRTDDQRTQYDLTVSYGDPEKWTVTGIANYAQVEFSQAYHQGTGPTPTFVQTSTNFDWGTTNTQGNWMLALLADWKAMERLKLTGSASLQKTTGGVDFWSGNYAGAGGFNGGPLVNYRTDNTQMQRYLLKADYQFTKNWSATAGYAFEKYQYNDDQMRGYMSYYPYYQSLGGTNNSWFSGAFANPSYTNNIFWATATYTFN